MKSLFKKLSIISIALFSISATSLGFIINLNSPSLTVIVPTGYIGQICLILSNCETNVLKIDSNGIGYINKSTYNNTYAKPLVLESDSTNITSRIVGYNPASFWSKGSFSMISTNNSTNTNEIHFMSFEIVPVGKEGQKQYYTTDIDQFIDVSKLCNNP